MRKKEIKEDIEELQRKIYKFFFARIIRKNYKNLKEVKKRINFWYKKFKKQARKEKLNFQDFNNFTLAIILARDDLEEN